VRPSFELTAENAEDVAHICLRLEGLPLAIELAAARIKLLTPRTLLARLASRLDTLTGGAQDLPTRQQTLHNTIAWSYNLLNDGEQMFFARLAVFRGGCSLEAMEAVCGPELPLPLLDGLESLVNKSLLQQHELPSGEPRFTMLETLHEYAWQRLRERAEHGEITGRHSTYYLDLVTQHEAALYGMEPLAVVAALRPELDNIRQAWQWLSSRALAEPTLLPALHTAIDGLAAFYEVASLFEEGAAVFARAAEGMAQEPASSEMEGVVCHLLARVAEFCEWRGEMAHAYEVAVQVLEMTGRLDLPRYRAQALQTLGILKRDTGEVEEAVQHLQEAIEIYSALGLHRPLALTYDWLGLIVSDLGRPDEAMDYLARAATLYAAAGNE